MILYQKQTQTKFKVKFRLDIKFILSKRDIIIPEQHESGNENRSITRGGINMSEFQSIFKRYEKKYMVTQDQRHAILNAAGSTIEKDPYYFTTVCSIYYDTPSKLLIRTSLDKPEYKEKLRLRSYGVPSGDSKVFLEIKKKYDGVVYKRRTSLKYENVDSFMSGVQNPQTQIEKELAWTIGYYKNIEPSVFISYDRTSFCGAHDKTFRLTFDTNVTYRETELSLASGIWGEKLIDEGMYIMEVKSPYAIPLWLAKTLDELEIRPTSFSKYGTVYKNSLTAAQKTSESYSFSPAKSYITQPLYA